MVFDSLFNILFPYRCVHCLAYLEAKGALCGACEAAIPLAEAVLRCGACDARLPEGKRVCHPSFPYSYAFAARYESEIMRDLIWALKFDLVRSAGESLGNLITSHAKKIPAVMESNHLIIPVPLGARRMRERGFNQAELIARAISEKLCIPLETQALLRTKNTPPQSDIHDLAIRKKNVSDCFAIKNASCVAGKNAILVDDVLTSGATMYAAAKTLKAAGARKICALVAARA